MKKSYLPLIIPDNYKTLSLCQALANDFHFLSTEQLWREIPELSTQGVYVTNPWSQSPRWGGVPWT